VPLEVSLMPNGDAIMANPNPLDSLRHRAVRHAFEDGAIDLVAGLFTVIVAAGTQRRVFLGLAVTYLLMLTPFWKALHDRLTSGRTGFAELPDEPPRQLLAVILLAGCLTMVVVAALTLPTGRAWNLEQWPRWAPMLSGLVLAGGFAHLARQTGFARYLLLAGVSLGASLFFWLYPFGPWINPSDRLTLSLFVTAAALLLVGAVTIARFVRSRPVVAEVPDAH
jgi:hypothetical protein